MRKDGFELWPAIDLMGGKVVRLYQGNFDQKVDYDVDLAVLIDTFNGFGAGIHVVDLDGARTGSQANMLVLETILKHAKLPVELGGGIRSVERVSELLAMGIDRAMIGTKALDEDFMTALQKAGLSQQVIISLDAKKGFVTTHGWLKDTDMTIEAALASLKKFRITQFMVTDIAKDGAMEGPNVALYESLIASYPDVRLYASGGVSKMSDLTNLAATGITGAVFGKAYYEGHLPVAELKAFSNVG